MKRFLLFFTFTLFITSSLLAQNPWKYEHSISFPDPDSTVFPLLCDVDENNRLWVISSKAQAPDARNAVYYADPGDTLFTKLIDYDLNGDSDTLAGNVGATRGIAALNGSVYVSFTVPYPKYAPFTLSGMYRYDNADSNAAFEWAADPGNTRGYGSYNHGIDITADSIIYAGITYNGPSFRLFNFSDRADIAFYSAYSAWIPGDPNDPGANGFGNLVEVGGGQTDGLDLIRDVAMVPGQNYNEVGNYFYTSRNSLAIDQLTGGIAVWNGGTILSALEYVSARVEDFDGYLSLIDSWPYGIDVDLDGTLWVAGIDSTRRWVKGFTIDGVNAIAEHELPSSTSMDFVDPDGAPMAGPCDVSISKDGGLAYVIDAFAKKAFVFDNTLVSVDDEIALLTNFNLEQNYPNPFNPATKIQFSIPEETNVKLIVSDILGREVSTIINEKLSAGSYTRVFDAKELPSGIYIYSLTANGQKFSRKMTLVK
jgi:hypothetical protein